MSLFSDRILVIPWAYGAGMDDATIMRPLLRAFGAWMDERFLLRCKAGGDDGGEEEREVAFAAPLGMPMQPPGLDCLIVSEWIKDDGLTRAPIFTSIHSFCVDEPDNIEAILRQFGHIVLLKCPSLQTPCVSRARWQEWETLEHSLVMRHAGRVSVFDSDRDVIVSRATRRRPSSTTFHTPPWRLVDI